MQDEATGSDMEVELKGKKNSHNTGLEHVIAWNVQGKTHKDQIYSQLFSPGMSKNITGNIWRRIELYWYDKDSD